MSQSVGEASSQKRVSISDIEISVDQDGNESSRRHNNNKNNNKNNNNNNNNNNNKERVFTEVLEVLEVLEGLGVGLSSHKPAPEKQDATLQKSQPEPCSDSAGFFSRHCFIESLRTTTPQFWDLQRTF
ncbi:unnamed protein product [Polarella glacialis]|uniref:Uncharacterized protein n=1 Tax=Polarella glacialis TaxID=89957 RepID=A0A813LE98_POLGL|nr:unnamed protein product [Polarella glacialis]